MRGEPSRKEPIVTIPATGPDVAVPWLRPLAVDTPPSLASPSRSAALPTHVIVALALVWTIWSSTYLAIRVVVHELPPMGSGGVRYVIAGTLLLAIQAVRGVPFPTRRQWLSALPIGALLFAVGNGLVASAERTISSGVAAVVCGTTPLWAGVVARAFGERTSSREWIGMALGFVGVLVLASGDDLRADPLSAGLLVLAPIGWSIGSIWSRRLPLAEGPSGAATQMVGGGAVMLVLGVLFGESMPTRASTGTLLALAYLIVAGSLVAFSAYAHLLRHARPAVALSYAYVNPVLAVVLGAVLGGETVGAPVVVATALIVGAVVLLVMREKPKPA